MKRIFTIFVLVFLFGNLSNFANAQTSDKVVILETQLGKIVIEFFPEDAPKTVENFLKLVDDGFYDGIVFHRIIKDFMIQGGDPLTKQIENQGQWGTGDAGYNIDAEFNTIKHDRGIVSMARGPDPNSASSQFFIVHKDSNFLDNQYTVFGRILTQESFDTLDAIASLSTGAGDVPLDTEQAKILKAEVVIRSEVSDLIELENPERVLSPTESTTESRTIEPTIERYTDENLGISFIAPSGWIIQQPEKTAPQVPDIVVIGPISEGFNPLISVTMVPTDGRSLEQSVAETKVSLQKVIDEDLLKIISEEKTTIDGKKAHVLQAWGIFESEAGAANLTFNEIRIATPDKFYTLAYINKGNNFENHIENFETVKNSLKILAAGEEVNQEGGGCLIATAAFGSELAPQVQQLRELRDNTILDTNSGTAFMNGFNQLYYSFSPTIADWERENPVFKEFVKVSITPMLATLSILSFVDINSEAEMLSYGISLILLNVGMYFVLPAIVVHRVRKFV